MNVCERDFFIQLYELMEKPKLFVDLGKNLTRYFHRNDYRNIAVYGVGKLGKLILRNIDVTQLESICTVDENKESRFENIETVTIKELVAREKLDLVLVTPLLDYPQIEAQICSMREIPVISAKELMCDMIDQSLFPDCGN